MRLLFLHICICIFVIRKILTVIPNSLIAHFWFEGGGGGWKGRAEGVEMTIGEVAL